MAAAGCSGGGVGAAVGAGPPGRPAAASRTNRPTSAPASSLGPGPAPAGPASLGPRLSATGVRASTLLPARPPALLLPLAGVRGTESQSCLPRCPPAAARGSRGQVSFLSLRERQTGEEVGGRSGGKRKGSEEKWPRSPSVMQNAKTVLGFNFLPLQSW